MVKKIALILVLSIPVLLRAADPPQRAPDADLKAISAQLASASADDRKTAIIAIRDMLQQQPARATSPLRATWCKQLFDAGEYAALEQLCLAGILAAPGETYSVEAFLQFRLRAAVAQGKTDIALGHAKSLFNVSGMASTSNAMFMVAEALGAATPGNSTRLNAFKGEQTAGAKTIDGAPAAIYAALPAYGSPVLASIKVDAEPYLAKARTTLAEDYWSLQARVNLHLVADRPAEAKELAERCYSTAAENQLPSASETLARCIKAQDGVIGRANSWVLAIRPKTGSGK